MCRVINLFDNNMPVMRTAVTEPFLDAQCSRLVGSDFEYRASDMIFTFLQ